MVEDQKEKEQLILDVLNILKMYIRPEFFFKEQESKENKAKDNIRASKQVNEVIKQQNMQNVEFVVSDTNENSVFDDEIPLILEE